MNEKLNLSFWNMRHAWLIGKTSYLETVRMKLFYALLALSLFSLGCSFLLQEFNFGSDELKFIMDFGFGGMTFFGSILAIVTASQLFYGEIEDRTVFTILAKPIRRSEFVVGKFIGAWFCIVSFVLCLTLCLMLSLFVRESILMSQYPEVFSEGRLLNYLDVLGFGFMQCVRLGMLGSIVILFSSYATSSLFSIIIGVVTWILGQLQHLAVNAWGQYDSLFLNTILFIVSIALPNFHLYDFGDKIALGESASISVYLQLVGYGALYCALYLSLAVLSFREREL
ncbi:ABC transporter permease [Puniceicoccaceae bacterium K14]|nr:ABC transporter permease [Puniceicoccaceae bacterium K14]